MDQLDISVFPASFAQRRLWFIQQFAPLSAAYNMVVSIALPPGLDASTVQRALDGLCAHHEALRTSFAVAEGDVVQRVAATGTVVLQASSAVTKEAFSAEVSASASRAFALDQAPLARAHAAFLPGGPPLFTLVVHHIIADGVTLNIFLGDLQALLQGLLQNRPVQLPQPPVEYADYAVWQRRTLTGNRLQGLTEYWRERLAAMPALELPGRRRGAKAGAQGRVVKLRIAPPACRQLRALAAESRATPFAVLLTAFCAVLGRFSGQRDFGIGIPVSGRSRVELERVAGLFVNSLVFRAVLPEAVSFAELLRKTAAALTADLSRQEMPFEQVVDALRIKRLADRNPLFQVMMQLQVATAPRPRAAASEEAPADLLDPEGLSSQLDLSLMLFDAGEAIEGGLVYAADVFDAAWIEQLAAGFGTFLEEALRDPERSIDRLPVLDDAARCVALALGEGPVRPWRAERLLHEGFYECARARPNAVAIRAPDRALSFGVLNRRALAIADALRQRGIEPGDMVALCAPRSADAVAAMVAVLHCGAAYLPMDAATPEHYRRFVLEDSGAKAVLVADGEHGLACGAPAIELGQAVRAGRGTPTQPAPRSAADTAYLIYTSGSTGRPKGVRIPHGAIANHMHWLLERFEIGPGDRVLQRTPLSFDASVWEVWAPLWSGAELVLAQADGPFDPVRLAQQIQSQGITVLQAVPSLLRALLPRARDGELRSLRLLCCGGETLAPDLVRQARAVCRATVVNLYGPTETTIDATFHLCEEGPAEDVPIGRPIANVTVRVLDAHMQAQPWGVPGELYIGGAAVGLGYHGRDALTAERFVDDPFAPGGRLFRSGDWVRMDRDGTLHYLGRRDGQVKLRGFRIELGEVEAQLALHESVAEAAAVIQGPASDDQRLIAFASRAAEYGATSEADLLSWLRARLPAHAVPARVAVLDALPRTAHGKIDRAALGALAPPSAVIDAAAATPATALELAICRCFADQLALEQVGVDDDFFLLGGHSLLVISACEALSRALGQSVSVVDLFEFPTARQLARALADRSSTPFQHSLLSGPQHSVGRGVAR